MRAREEEYAELTDLGYGRTSSTWTRRRYPAPAEAEDVLGPNGNARTGPPRSRSGQYYSPPGTSYTIIERPSSVLHMHHSRDRERDYGHYSSLGSPRGEFFPINHFIFD